MKTIYQRITTGLTAAALIVAQVIMPAQVAFTYTAPTGVVDKVQICHATNSSTNPYETPEPNVSSVDPTAGHSGHTGPVWNPTLKDLKIDWGDIIPPFQYLGPQGETLSYAGMNWTAEGQAFYANNCEIPPVLAKDATANVVVTDPTCDATGVASVSGLANATLTGELDQSVGAHDAVFTANTGHLFADGNATKTVSYTINPALTGNECEEEPAHDATANVVVTDSTCDASGAASVSGVANATLTGALNQTVGTHDAVFTATTGHLFANGETTYTISYTIPPVLTGEQCEETPKPCTVSDNVYLTPWIYDGEEYPFAGAWPTTGVPATATFTDEGLLLSTPEKESYTLGFIDAGNTALSDIDTIAYRTIRDSSSTGFAQTLPAYILLVDVDGNSTTDNSTYFFYEPYYNGTVIEDDFQDWNLIGAAKWYVSGTGQALKTWDQLVAMYPAAKVTAYGFNQGTSNEGTNAYIVFMDFDCATTTFVKPGAGGGGVVTPPVEPPVTPVLPATPVTPAATLPAELPVTGGITSLSAVIIALATAVAAYGAVYFAQGSRRYEQ